MNKKMKIIELLNIIAQVEDIEKLPKKIKYYDYIYELQIASRDYYCKTEDDYLTGRVDDKPLNSFLNDTVEILEDNTEEIEETNLCYVTCESDFKNMNIVKLLNKFFEKNDLIVNELVRAVNKIRKEKE